MSKVICDVCGTSYSETATQCPICGCVRPADSIAVDEPEQEEGGYTYVKGGRFSKANVRKRNQGVETPKVAPKAPPKDKKPVNKKLIGLIIVITCLVLILSLLAYFVITQLPKNEEPKNDPVETLDIPCTGIKIYPRTFEFTNAGDSLNLSVDCSPINTTDKVEYTSSNTDVVAVDDKGNVTFVGNGKAEIIIKCGGIEDRCIITCNVPAVDEPTEPDLTEEPTAPLGQIRFLTTLIQTTDYYQCEPGGAPYTLYVGDVPVNEIHWYSDDSSVAEIRDGVVYMRANGTTTVYAEYGEQKLSCTVIVGSGDGDNLLPPDTDIDLSKYTGWCKYGGGWKVPLHETVCCLIDYKNYSSCIDTTLNNESLSFALYELETGAKIFLSWQPVFEHDSVNYNSETKVFTRNSDVERGHALYKAVYGDETIYLYIR